MSYKHQTGETCLDQRIKSLGVTKQQSHGPYDEYIENFTSVWLSPRHQGTIVTTGTELIEFAGWCCHPNTTPPNTL